METKEFLETHLAIAIEAARALPPCREASLVVTKLEEAVMWLDKVKANG